MKHKIIAALTVAVLVVPGVSLAQTMSVASLQAEIAALTAQLQQLEAQLTAAGGSTTTATTPTTSSCYAFNSNLSFGMSGSAVTALQADLQKDGESVNITGTFDAQTAAAVTSFQEKYQTTILAPYSLTRGTGRVGVTTRAKLNSLFGCGTTNPIVTPTPAPPSTTQNSSVSLTANGQSGVVSANSGSQITLAWTSSGVTSCSANSNGSWTGSINTSGTSLVTLPSAVSEAGIQYTLTCTTSSGGSVQSAVQVNVQPSTNTSNSNGFTISPSVTTDFTQGSNNTISWSGGACSAGSPNSCVTLELENAQGSCYTPAAGTPCNVGFVPAPVNSPSSGSYSWNAQTVCGSTAPYVSTWANCTSVAPGLYRILAMDANGNSVSSGDIWITAATTTSSNTPSISITSPTNGPAWTAGTTQQITWTSQNVSGYIGINLNNLSVQSESSITQIAENLPSTATSFSWAIPANTAPGQYEVQVWSGAAGNIAVSQPFTITAASSIPTISSSVNFEVNSSTNPITVAQGDYANFSWTSSNVTTCTQVGGWYSSQNPLPLNGSQSWSSLPKTATGSVSMGVSCMTPSGATVQSNLVSVTPAALTISVVQDPTVASTLSVPANGKKELLASYKVTASGPEGVALTSVDFNISQDVTSTRLSLQNPEVYLSVAGTSKGTWWSQPPYATTNFVPGYQGNGDNIMQGSFTIPANGTAYVQIYGDTVSATPGTYIAPIILNSIEGGGAGIPIYAYIHNAEWLMFGIANLAGQNVTVTSQ